VGNAGIFVGQPDVLGLAHRTAGDGGRGVVGLEKLRITHKAAGCRRFVLSPAIGAVVMSLSTIIVAINAQFLRRTKVTTTQLLKP
jgi:hypothetical protein